MAKQLRCKDLGMDCPFSVISPDEQEAMEMGNMHAQKYHSEKMANMTDEQKKEMMEQVKSVIRDVEEDSTAV
ncbi:MAG: hypothetical protein A2857_06070 [Candidatus Levybacteria bacterium RIFCSPHIGHO2_01_FULL_36_15]|nr:MAG: hypothetical protein A2857_06070 [Candidatus Levybacteria bacterium RIFCSPHIGHO2_01_FULL_36_15]OGH37552.1 MAG: hypothetical protein A2905_01275 [Candidatus Levybacteria bacterium RIFCSPLOWO2_01_FULL_36_10]